MAAKSHKSHSVAKKTHKAKKASPAKHARKVAKAKKASPVKKHAHKSAKHVSKKRSVKK